MRPPDAQFGPIEAERTEIQRMRCEEPEAKPRSAG
jgi:hypothetical protein